MAGYELVVRSEFSAAHRLHMPDGELEPMHSHTWRIEVFLLSRELDGFDLVADFTVLQESLGQVTGRLEGACLNELPAFSSCNPSAERVARYLSERYVKTLPAGVRLAKVRVWETGNCAAAYIPSDIQTEGVD